MRDTDDFFEFLHDDDDGPVILVIQPPYLPTVIKRLERARRPRKLPEQTAALDLVIATIRRIADPKRIDGPCALRAVMDKAAKRDKKFRDALDVIGFER